MAPSDWRLHANLCLPPFVRTITERECEGRSREEGRALEFGPDDENTWLGRAKLRHRAGRLDAAMEDLQKAVELRPGYGWALVEKSSVLRELDRLDEALEAIDQALEASPRFRAAWRVKGEILTALGRDADAAAAYEKAGDWGSAFTAMVIRTSLLSAGST